VTRNSLHGGRRERVGKPYAPRRVVDRDQDALAMTERKRDTHVGEEEAEELEEEAAEHNPDRQTRREALELELMEEERSEAGEDIGDEID
jgi:hypothetical protein